MLFESNRGRLCRIMIAAAASFARAGPVAGDVDLSITNAPSNTSCVALGQRMYFRETVRVGGGTAQNVYMRAKLPLGTSFAPSITTAPNCTACGDLVTCSLGSIAVGATNFQIGVNVDSVPPRGLQLVSLASVFGGDLDPNTQNNSQASTPISVIVNPPPGSCLFVTTLQPGTYMSTGGQPLSVFGGGFQPGATVTVSSTALGGVSYVSSAQLNSTSPALPPGQHDLIVTNPDQGVATLIGGYVVSDPVPTGFVPLTPCRVFDTRDASGAPAMGAGTSRVFPVAGRCGVPFSARAVAINVTVVPGAAGGSLSVYAGDLAPPLASFLSFDAANVRANNGYYPLATNGAGTVGMVNGSAATVDVILDAFGYFQ